MNLFCLLCIPLVYFLRGAIAPKDRNSIWALPLGGIMVVVQYFVGPLVRNPGGFGFPRWMSGFIDVIGLPVLIPLAVCLALVLMKVFSVDYAGFTLLWLAPLAAIRSIVENSPSPLSLVFVPLLWIALAIGVPFFINCIERKPRWYVIIPSSLGIIALPAVATTSWWAFFSQQTLLGSSLLLATFIPAITSFFILSYKDLREEEGSPNYTNEHE